MDIPNRLACLFTAEIRERNGTAVVEIPERELTIGDLDADETYSVAILARGEAPADDSPEPRRTDRSSPTSREPPVSAGETREVEIEDIGVQGDGIARVERGFVVIVPDTELGERVTIEITDVGENVAFAEVIDRQTHVR